MIRVVFTYNWWRTIIHSSMNFIDEGTAIVLIVEISHIKIRLNSTKRNGIVVLADIFEEMKAVFSISRRMVNIVDQKLAQSIVVLSYIWNYNFTYL